MLLMMKYKKTFLHSDPLFFDNLEYFRLIDVLQSYPFSARENTIYQQEISLDSFILGHVYENILTINESRQALSIRPKMVCYMTEEALVGYFRVHLLKEKYDVDNWIEEKIRPLVVDGQEIECSDTEREMLLRWILLVIIDPSCGCGICNRCVAENSIDCQMFGFGWFDREKIVCQSRLVE